VTIGSSRQEAAQGTAVPRARSTLVERVVRARFRM
jgi:hypothetical protein